MSGTKKSRREGIARGRMYLKAHLGWLSGFPLKVSPGQLIWLALPRHGDWLSHEMTLTGRDLHRTSRTWQKLTTRFPHALPQIVEDLDHWQNGVPGLLSLLNEVIHQGKALPRSLFDVPDFYPSAICQDAQALAKEQPELQPWLAALSWFDYLYPSEAAAAVTWSRQHAGDLATIVTYNKGLSGTILIHQLWSLTNRDSADLVASIHRLLGNPQLYTIPNTDAQSYSLQWTQLLSIIAHGKERPIFPERPDTSLGHTLVAFLAGLVGQRRQRRRNALILFNLVWSEEVLAAWVDWWANTDRLVQRAKQLNRMQDQFAIRNESKWLRKRLHVGRQQLPPPMLLDRIISAVELAAPESAFCRELMQILPLMPKAGNGAMMRAALLNYWARLLIPYKQQLPILLRCLRKSWQHAKNREDMLALWTSHFSEWRRGRLFSGWSVEVAILGNAPEQRLWPVICDTFAACAGIAFQMDTATDQDGDVDANRVIDEDILLRLAVMTEDANQAEALVASLLSQPLKTTYLETDLLSCAYHLDDGRGHFGHLVAKLQNAQREESWFIPALRSAVDQLEACGWQGMATDQILNGQIKQLAHLGQRLQILTQFGHVVSPPSPLPPPTDTPSWIKSYPQSLMPVLRLLASLDPAAQKRATRVLNKDIPDDNQLQQEITVLLHKLAENPSQSKLEQRLANLEHRLASPKPVSAQRLTRLEEKLMRLVAQQALVVWEEDINATLRTTLSAEVGVADLPDWFMTSRQLHVIFNMLQLPSAFRQLGFRLLRIRCDPPPWSLIDDPANKHFITGMEQRGVNMEPWLNPPAPQQFIGANGRVVYLQFETDPLEIFQMGAYFNTCLSPDDFNFFSVFANAADINKHVIYARDERQQVVGRCLLALTQEGNLLTFEPYCHDPKLGFANMVAEVVTELATQMGVSIHIKGLVPALVAPNWYDDGPRDLTDRFEFLHPNSDFRKKIPSMKPEQFLKEVERLFAPLPLNALSLTLILGLPELAENPTLILPLLPYLKIEKTVPDDVMIKAVKLARQAGEERFVHKIARTWIPRYLQRNLRYINYYWFETELVVMLAEFNPSAALRFLRNSRPRGVRRDREEVGWRREALAVAHENLGRYALAEKLRT